MMHDLEAVGDMSHGNEMDKRVITLDNKAQEYGSERSSELMTHEQELELEEDLRTRGLDIDLFDYEFKDLNDPIQSTLEKKTPLVKTQDLRSKLPGGKERSGGESGMSRQIQKRLRHPMAGRLGRGKGAQNMKSTIRCVRKDNPVRMTSLRNLGCLIDVRDLRSFPRISFQIKSDNLVNRHLDLESSRGKGSLPQTPDSERPEYTPEATGSTDQPLGKLLKDSFLPGEPWYDVPKPNDTEVTQQYGNCNFRDKCCVNWVVRYQEAAIASLVKVTFGTYLGERLELVDTKEDLIGILNSLVVELNAISEKAKQFYMSYHWGKIQAGGYGMEGRSSRTIKKTNLYSVRMRFMLMTRHLLQASACLELGGAPRDAMVVVRKAVSFSWYALHLSVLLP